MSATAAGCGSSVGMNFGKEYYKMIVNAGYRGKVGAAAPKFTYTGQYNIRKDGVVELLTSGTIVFLEPKVIDVFMVGGGGGGSGSNLEYGQGFGGGGGGYTRTNKRVAVQANTEYPVTVGNGGTPGATGGASGFNAYTVNGGRGGAIISGQTNRYFGGSGGCGGGGGVSSNSDYGTGGYDGSNGESGYPSSNQYGTGQLFTTREFNENGGKLYAGGGGGGRYMVSQSPVVSMGGNGGGGSGGWSGSRAYGLTQAPSPGVANTGGGGGGGACASTTVYVNGASGGSGIVCFRDAQELPELAGTWVLNERLYAPENTINQTIQFTAKESATSAEQAYANFYSDTSALKFTRATGSTTTVYTYSSNKWNTKYKYLTFPAGATASDEFRAWLASNATKQ